MQASQDAMKFKRRRMSNYMYAFIGTYLQGKDRTSPIGV